MIETEQIFVLVGVILVLFFAILLLTSKKYKSHPNKFLASSLITLAVIILRINGLLEQVFLEGLFSFFRLEYLFSVFLYMYVFITLKEPITRYNLILLLSPFIVFSALYSFVAVSDWFAYEAFDGLLESIEPYEIYITIIFNITVVLLFMLKVKGSSVETAFKKWIYTIAFGLILVMLSFLTLELIEIIFDVYYWSYLGIGISIFFIGIAYVGVQQLQVETEKKSINKIYNNKKNNSQIPTGKIPPGHFNHMQQLMKDEELFRNPSLDRGILANRLGLSASSITRILKEEGQISFNDFINRYRIDLAKNMLNDPRFDIFSLEAIGQEVGFKSRSTFYETFKKEVGISPGAYKKQ